MANPALIKAAVVLLTDKRTWKAIGVVIAAILTPFILLVVILCSMLSGTANHNNAAVELTFYGGSLPITMPGEYKDYITEMRDCFSSLDGAIATVEGMMEDGDSLDSNRIKAVFYALNFGTEHLPCAGPKPGSLWTALWNTEDCAHTGTEEGRRGVHLCPYRGPIPIGGPARPSTAECGRCAPGRAAHLQTIWPTSPRSTCGWSTGTSMWARKCPLEGGNGTHDLIAEMIKRFGGGARPKDGFLSPLPGGRRDKVTSEFGYQPEPHRRRQRGAHRAGHGEFPLGTPVRAVKDGRVLFVQLQADRVRLPSGH